MRAQRIRIGIALAVLAALLLVGCAPSADGGTGSSLPTTDDAPSLPSDEPTETSGGGDTGYYLLSDYKLVRSNDASGIIISSIGDLYSSVIKSYGGFGGIGNDWVSAGTDTSSEEISSLAEILVGRTNRPESAIADGLGENEYTIAAVGNKIVVAGGSDIATNAACTALLQLIAEKDGKYCMKLDKNGVSGTVDLSSSYRILATDQKNSAVSVYELSFSTDISTSKALKSFKFEKYNIADARLREYNGKTVLLAAYGSSFAKVIDYESGEVIFSTDGTAKNPHAAELMPNGVLAVAASDGSQVRFFNINSPNATVAEFDLADAHGALWDPSLGVLWVIGSDMLKALEVSVGENGAPNVTERTDLSYTIPVGSAHDLQPVYGNTDRLWITTATTVFQFSKSDGSFHTDYDGAELISRAAVKGIGNFDDGSVISIVPDGGFKSWTSKSASFLIKKDGKLVADTCVSDDGGFYKVRVANKNYQ